MSFVAPRSRTSGCNGTDMSQGFAPRDIFPPTQLLKYLPEYIRTAKNLSTPIDRMLFRFRKVGWPSKRPTQRLMYKENGLKPQLSLILPSLFEKKHPIYSLLASTCSPRTPPASSPSHTSCAASSPLLSSSASHSLPRRLDIARSSRL